MMTREVAVRRGLSAARGILIALLASLVFWAALGLLITSKAEATPRQAHRVVRLAHSADPPVYVLDNVSTTQIDKAGRATCNAFAPLAPVTPREIWAVARRVKPPQWTRYETAIVSASLLIVYCPWELANGYS